MLREHIEEKLKEKQILLMTHLVLGYPSFDANRQVVAAMAEGGVDLMELQIPFSEPVADGPVISRACQDAIEAGAKVRECLSFAAEMTKKHDIPFLFMTYYNIIFRHGEERFLEEAVRMGIRGLIVPDLPPEEGGSYLRKAKEAGVAPVQIFAPTTTDERMAELADTADGFIYCVARRGVTGKQTDFDSGFDAYLKRCRAATALPLAVGFGIREKKDVDLLRGKADIAVIGTRTIELVEKEGVEAVGPFIKSLR
jgi:tryptophan synthase alpha chain